MSKLPHIQGTSYMPRLLHIKFKISQDSEYGYICIPLSTGVLSLHFPVCSLIQVTVCYTVFFSRPLPLANRLKLPNNAIIGTSEHSSAHRFPLVSRDDFEPILITSNLDHRTSAAESRHNVGVRLYRDGNSGCTTHFFETVRSFMCNHICIDVINRSTGTC